jgi:hypothetical protein
MFMLPLEMDGPSGSLSLLLMPRLTGKTSVVEVLAGGNSNGNVVVAMLFRRAEFLIFVVYYLAFFHIIFGLFVNIS